MDFSANGGSGAPDDSDPLGLTSKQALILQWKVVQRSLRSRSATVEPVAKSSGEGIKADSSVRLYILPNTYLGTLTTNGSGAYVGSVPVPASITPGVHTLQANGLAPDGAERSLNIGVLVKPTVVALRPATASARVLFAPMSPQLGAQEKSTLQALVKQTGKQGVRVVSIGDVQPTTATANDQALSTQRARNVVAYLRMLGLKGEFVVRGDGVATQQGAAARRVNVTVTYRRQRGARGHLGTLMGGAGAVIPHLPRLHGTPRVRRVSTRRPPVGSGSRSFGTS